MDNKIYLYGASGHCKVVVDILKLNNDEIEQILDDNPSGKTLFDIPVVLNSRDFDLNGKKVFITIGDNSIRERIAKSIDTKFHIAIHPNSIVSSFASIDEGTVIMAGAVVNAGASIGKHCIINTGAIVEHDCILNDYVHISPNAAVAGDVTVGVGSHIGIGASIIQGIKIGKWTVIGAGTVILTDVPDYAIVVGNPGKIIKFRKNE